MTESTHIHTKQKRWVIRNAKSLGLVTLSVVSTTALLFSNLESITAFINAHMPGAVARQFPFTMQVSSSDVDGVQKTPFYKEEHIQEGTLVRPFRNNDFGLPILDFRIVNNSKQSTLVRELILKVAKSQPDNRPILSWDKRLNLANGENQLTFGNDGWAAAVDAKITNVVGTFLPKHGAAKTTPPFEIALGKIDKQSREVSLPSLIKDQFKLEKLPDSDSANLAGELAYSYVDAGGTTKAVRTPFRMAIMNRHLELPGAPPAEGPGQEYQSTQLLQTNGQNYDVHCPVSVNLEPQKTGRFIVTICSRQSAIHDFDVVVALTNGANIKLGHYRLEFFLPRSKSAIVSSMVASPHPVRFTSIDGSTDDMPGTSGEEEGVDDVGDSTKDAADNTKDPVAPGIGPEVDKISSGQDEVGDENTGVEKQKVNSRPTEGLQVLKATYPYGVPVPGHPDIVESPFLSGKFVDVSGFDHNSLIQDPYVHQLFLVP